MNIYVVTHKDYQFPSDAVYRPIKVGPGKMKTEILSDASGDNISPLNPYFCELTALYWVWKNSKEDIVGLVHYRRYFSSTNSGLKINGRGILNSDEIKNLMNDYDLVVAKPRNYYIVKIKDHYIKAHGESDFEILREEVKRSEPDYLDSFDAVMDGRKISLYNMFIAKREIIEEYCDWLFKILFAIKDKIPYESYDAYQRRVFGFMSERLFNVWIRKNAEKIKIKEMAVSNIEGENVFKKGVGLIKRQYLAGK
jgi:hypothetical protein